MHWEDCARISKMSESEINASYQNVPEEFTALNYKRSPEKNFKTNRRYRLSQFQILIARHNDPDRKDIYGTPIYILGPPLTGR